MRFQIYRDSQSKLSHLRCPQIKAIHHIGQYIKIRLQGLNPFLMMVCSMYLLMTTVSWFPRTVLLKSQEDMYLVISPFVKVHLFKLQLCRRNQYFQDINAIRVIPMLDFIFKCKGMSLILFLRRRSLTEGLQREVILWLPLIVTSRRRWHIRLFYHNKKRREMSS